MALTAARLRELLHYDPEAGTFSWRVTKGRVLAGSPAGRQRKDGYVVLCVDQVDYLAHRLAWLYTHGAWPSGDVDHRDRCRANNAISNLRDATRSQNTANSPAHSDNRIGLKGVSRTRGGRYRARIRREGREVLLGAFDSPEEAAEAYRVAALATFGEFASAS